MAAPVSRRDFARLFAAGGSAALFADPLFARERGATADILPAGPSAGEPFWTSVREQFVMPPDLGVMNAANLCPASRPALEALTRESKSVDVDPSPNNRARLMPEKEQTRTALAAFLRVTPEEIVITRNTSEGNNMISNGLDLKAGDEVLLHEDNHPSNLVAWQEKAKRFGFSVAIVPQKNPHPGAEYYVDAFAKAITPRTRLISITHLTSTVGDLMPAKELSALAHARGLLFQLDGAQTFGLLDVNLADIQPDFYTGSSHKWPCGARECGVLYVKASTQPKLWPTVYSAYPGAVGLSKTFESFGQRDEATMIALHAALDFQTKVGRAAIEQRARALTTQLMDGLVKIPGLTVWTSPIAERRAAVVTFVPGSLDANKLANALYANEKIGITTRGGKDRPGIRVSPHFYNTPQEVDRLLAAVTKYTKSGV